MDDHPLLTVKDAASRLNVSTAAGLPPGGQRPAPRLPGGEGQRAYTHPSFGHRRVPGQSHDPVGPEPPGTDATPSSESIWEVPLKFRRP